MKKIIALLLCVVMITCMFAGCSNDPAAETPTPGTPTTDGNTSVKRIVDAGEAAMKGDSTEWKIAVVCKDSANAWFVRMDAGVQQFAADTGINAYQKGPSSCDAALQVQVIEDVINQGIDALCVVPVDPAACEPVLKEARERGIVVITHEGSTCQNVDFDLEAFDNSGYGAFIMDKLQEAMGGSGIYTTMVAHLTNASQNEWADGAVARQKEAYPGLTLLDAMPRLESENNSEKAYEAAKEILKTYPDITGFVGTSSMDTPGVARAIDELGLKGKVFVVGTGMPNECRELIKDGSLSYITLWDPAEAGYAMCVMARMILEGREVGVGTDLGLASYNSLAAASADGKVLTGAGWIAINADNVDNYDF